MKIKITALFILTISLFACKSSQFISAKSEYNKLNLDFKTTSTTFIDKRQNISPDEDIQLSVISMPGQQVLFYPKIKESHKNAILETIRENTNPSSANDAKITVTILQAKKEFSATGWSEKEIVNLRLMLTIEIDGKETQLIEYGEFFRSSMDANYKRFERLYIQSLKEVTLQALTDY